MLDKHLKYYRQHGFWEYVKFLADKFFLVLGYLFFYPLYAVVAALKPLKVIRFGHMRTDRIGHLAANMGYYLCEREHGYAPKNTFDIFYYYGFVSNHLLVKMWKRSLIVSYWAGIFGRVLERQKFGAEHRIKIYPYDRYALREITKPQLCFRTEEIIKAKARLAEILPHPELPYICLLNRDSSYLQKSMPHNNWAYHDYRNCDIANYRLAADKMAEGGHTVIRMGNTVEEPLNATHPDVVDYGYKQYAVELLDVYLSTHCKLFVTCGTGMDTLANMFNLPVIYVNFLPYYSIYSFSTVMTIPKLLYLSGENRLLTFKEIFTSEIANFATSEAYEKAGLRVIENTPDEISDACLEMLSRIDKTWTETPEDRELQARFWKYFPKNKVHGGEIKSHIGSKFLKKYEHLLPPLHEVT